MKYHFSPAVTAELDRFTKPLALKYVALNRYHNYLGMFLQWMEQAQLTSDKVRTVDILSFIASIKATASREIQNRTLQIVRQYFDYKQHPHNPAMGIKIKGAIKRIPHNLLDKETLEGLYTRLPALRTATGGGSDGQENYQALTLNNYRDKVITGLVVYQALTSGDLHTLRCGDVKLAEGKLYIRAHNNMNSRVLALEGFQIMELHEYIEQIRPQFLGSSFSEQLFISSKGNERIMNTLRKLMATLRGLHPEVKTLMQLRSSVLAEWLKDKDVRIVQYMAGHKRVSSTERYQAINLEDLQEQLNKFHPLG